eukprot:3681602-Lingulodinium_polyedra.AAC.1
MDVVGVGGVVAAYLLHACASARLRVSTPTHRAFTSKHRDVCSAVAQENTVELAHIEISC